MIFLVILSALFLSISSISKKFFKKDCPLFFTATYCFFAGIVFLFASRFKFSFDVRILPYAFLFAGAYAVCNLTMLVALKRGSLSITGLVLAYSLILPTFYGVFFLDEKPSLFFYIGFVFLIVGIFLIGYKKSTEKKEEKTNKNQFVVWCIVVAISFITNGLCAIVQTAQQKALNGHYKSEFMLIALGLSVLGMLICAFITERNKIKEGFKDSIIYGSVSGLSNGLLNLFVMLSVNYLSVSLVFPLISGLNLLFNFVVARLVFKEKYKIAQYVGFVISIISVVFMNI